MHWSPGGDGHCHSYQGSSSSPALWRSQKKKKKRNRGEVFKKTWKLFLLILQPEGTMLYFNSLSLLCKPQWMENGKWWWDSPCWLKRTKPRPLMTHLRENHEANCHTEKQGRERERTSLQDCTPSLTLITSRRSQEAAAVNYVWHVLKLMFVTILKWVTIRMPCSGWHLT